MWKTKEGYDVDIDETKLIPVKLAVTVVTEGSIFFAPRSVEKLLPGPNEEGLGNMARGIIPGKKCPHCGRENVLLVLRQKCGTWQWVICLQCDRQSFSKDFNG